MVRRHDHERIVQLAGRLQRFDRVAEPLICTFDGHGVVEQIAAHDVVVGEVLRNDDVGRISPGVDTGIALVAPMWLLRADPKTERMSRPGWARKSANWPPTSESAVWGVGGLALGLLYPRPAGLWAKPPACQSPGAQPLPANPTS